MAEPLETEVDTEGVLTPVEAIPPLPDLEDLEDPAVEASVLVVDEPEPPTGRSWAYDFPEQAFYVSGRGPLGTTGQQTLLYWIEKCLRTRRGAYDVYGDDFGADGLYDDIIGEPFEPVMVPLVAERVRDALKFHPRISDVVDFTASLSEDTTVLFCGFRVILEDADTLDIADLELG